MASFGLDEWFLRLNDGGWMALVVAVLLGLRHATDPDHITAVSTLILSDTHERTRRAALLGLFWGLGHATTLFGLGIPAVLFRSYLPDAVQRAAELGIGLIIVVLAARLLLRWRRGYFHAHPHSHGAVQHWHPHAHEHGPAGHSAVHTHRHEAPLGRSPLAAFGNGLMHGSGGSAPVGILLVGAIPGRSHAVLALALFAAATAVSMSLASTAFGYALARGPVARRLSHLVPLFGTASLLFGVWYAVSAL
ncbi:MAG: hypothetical protein ACREMX_14495 [Gemmatimonadales bacterium]